MPSSLRLNNNRFTALYPPKKNHSTPYACVLPATQQTHAVAIYSCVFAPYKSAYWVRRRKKKTLKIIRLP